MSSVLSIEPSGTETLIEDASEDPQQRTNLIDLSDKQH